MKERLYKFWLSAVIPLGSFVFYWAEIGRDNLGRDGNPYSGTVTDLLWGALVTVILIAIMYLYFPLSKWIERFSPAWSFGITCSIGFSIIGLMMDTVGGYAWGSYAWFFFLWLTVDFIVMSKERKQDYDRSLFKRQRPIEEESAHLDKAEA